MCGICGMFGFSRGDGEEALSRMTTRLRHRGPDGEGTKWFDNVGFGHRRLKILDLTDAAAQPMTDPSNRGTLIYNGEVYNFVELRKELEHQGVQFKSSGDTEVVLQAILAYGIKSALRRMQGEFALAFYDHAGKTVTLARDRYGIKPLYYLKQGDGKALRLVFSSELRSLREYHGHDWKIQPERLGEYLSLGYVLSPRTIYEGVERVRPGFLVKVGPHACEEETWYSLPDVPSSGESVPDEAAAAEELRAKLKSAVAERLVADVPVGVFLSGGIDSSIVAALAAKSSSKPVKTFSVGFPEDPKFDESRYAEVVAREYSTEHCSIAVTASELREAVPQVLDSLGEPFGDSSLIASYVLAEATRKEVKVALSGDGADELFGGYRKYVAEAVSRSIGPLGRAAASAAGPLSLLLPCSRNTTLGELVRRIRKFSRGQYSDPAMRHVTWMLLDDPALLNKVSGEVAKSVELLRTKFASVSSSASDPENAMLMFDFGTVLLDDMLPKVDTASMLASLEVRVPFLDHRVAELALSLPGPMKLKGLRRKHILLKALGSLLPREILERSKHGFDVPVGRWLKNEFRDRWFDLLAVGRKKLGHLLDYDVIEQVYARHVSGRTDASYLLWSVFVLNWWANASGA